MSAAISGRSLRDPGVAFSGLAAGYDAAFTHSSLGAALRARVWETLDATFAPGQTVLDVGCGTGADAFHLAERGLSVIALDAAPAMAAAARAKTRAVRPGSVDVLVARMEDGLPMFADGSLDGVVSSFGALNCVADLVGVGASLARVTRPGGYLVLTVMGPLCISEIAYNLLRLRPGIAFRRWRRGGTIARVGDRSIHVYYPSGGALSRVLAREGFVLASLVGLGLVLPPTDASSWLERHPRALMTAAHADRALGQIPGAASLSDHYLAVFRKLPGAAR